MGPRPILSFFFQEDPTCSICVILLTNRQRNGHENNTSLAELKKEKKYKGLKLLVAALPQKRIFDINEVFLDDIHIYILNCEY